MAKPKNSISRRDALKLGGVALAGASLATLAGCAPKSTAASSSSSTDAATALSADGTVTARSHYQWLGSEPSVDDSQVVKTVDVDVVVLGSGHSGTQCAKSAAESGATLAVLESQAEETQFYYGEDIGTFNSEYVKKLGYGPYDEMDILEQLKRTGGYRVNSELIKCYIENSGPMADSFIGLVQQRKPDLLKNMNVQQPNTDFWTDKSKPQDMGNFKTYVGTFCMRKDILDQAVSGVGAYSTIGDAEGVCREYAIEHGAQWFFGTTAMKVIVDNGKAVGAYGKDSDGNVIRFNAKKAVVIAMGAFQNNMEMMKEFFRESWELQAKDGTDAFGNATDGSATRDIGMGHKIGCWAGGRMESGPMASLANVSAPGPFGFAPTLYLNSLGKRFMNEADFNAIGAQVCRQPKGLYCCIYGNNYEEIIKRGGTNHGGTDFGQATYVSQWKEDMTKVVAAGAEGYLVRHGCLTERANMQQTRMYGANDLATLAGYLGYKVDAVQNIVESVAAYNRLVQAGVDTQYGKKSDFLLPIEGPFYGSVDTSVGQAATAVTLGGLATDGKFNVLADDDSSIGGLYAIGNCCGGRFALTYPGILAGNSIGQAMTNGYACGRIVASL
jgi:hypothetical protein